MLQFITHQTSRYTYEQSAIQALKGGCRWIQLRMKDASPDQVVHIATGLKEICKDFQATFIIDDHVDIALKVGADGVHLGKNDMPVSEARKLTGKDFIIGGTANTAADMIRLTEAGADYIGLGPFRFTETKKNLSPVLGLQGYRNIMAEYHSRSLRLPVVAIGGISANDIPNLMLTGITGIALSGTILQASDPIAETQHILTLIQQNNQ